MTVELKKESYEMESAEIEVEFRAKIFMQKNKR